MQMRQLDKLCIWIKRSNFNDYELTLSAQCLLEQKQSLICFRISIDFVSTLHIHFKCVYFHRWRFDWVLNVIAFSVLFAEMEFIRFRLRIRFISQGTFAWTFDYFFTCNSQHFTKNSYIFNWYDLRMSQ